MLMSAENKTIVADRHDGHRPSDGFYQTLWGGGNTHTHTCPALFLVLTLEKHSLFNPPPHYLAPPCSPQECSNNNNALSGRSAPNTQSFLSQRELQQFAHR